MSNINKITQPLSKNDAIVAGILAGSKLKTPACETEESSQQNLITMKKLIFTLLFAASIGLASAQNTADLNGVTFGFGIGRSHTFDQVDDYSLTTDAKHRLKIQPLSKNAFVVSSVVMFKLGKVAFDEDAKKLVRQDYVNNVKLLNQELLNNDKQGKKDGAKQEANDTKQQNKDGAFNEKDDAVKQQNKHDAGQGDNDAQKSTTSTIETLKNSVASSSKISFVDRLSINVALNLVNISQDIAFNKQIDGGIGLGYLLAPELQVSLFYDMTSVSQLRDYVVSSYKDKSIPTADGKIYNALDTKDNNLFYSKTINGISLKLVFSIGNKKAPQTTAKR